jgi:hypothetical protein
MDTTLTKSEKTPNEKNAVIGRIFGSYSASCWLGLRWLGSRERFDEG